MLLDCLLLLGELLPPRLLSFEGQSTRAGGERRLAELHQARTSSVQISS